MSALAAKKAIIKFDILGTKTPVGEVRSFSLETALGTIDVSTLATNWKKYIVGQAGWSSSMEMFYDPSDPGQEELVDRALAGTPCEFTFLPFGEDEPAEYVGTGRITNWTPSGATEDAVGVSISVQGDGELELNPV